MRRSVCRESVVKIDLIARLTALCGDAFEEVLRDSLIFSLERLDEDHSAVRLCLLRIQALDA